MARGANKIIAAPIRHSAAPLASKARPATPRYGRRHRPHPPPARSEGVSGSSQAKAASKARPGTSRSAGAPNRIQAQTAKHPAILASAATAQSATVGMARIARPWSDGQPGRDRHGISRGRPRPRSPGSRQSHCPRIATASAAGLPSVPLTARSALRLPPTAPGRWHQRRRKTGRAGPTGCERRGSHPAETQIRARG